MRTPRPGRRTPASDLKAILQGRLSTAGRDPRIAVLGVGSTLRGDDAAGLLAAQELTKLLAGQRRPSTGQPTVVFLGETAPENLTGPIKEFRPSCLIVLDAVDAGAEPGGVAVLDPAQIDSGAGVSTHSASLRLLIGYLGQFMQLDAIIIGIQPLRLDLGGPPSEPVRQAATAVAEAIAAATTY
jgi:hydrogenase maturation protease